MRIKANPIGLLLLLAFAAFASARAAEPVRGGTMVMIVQPEPSTLAHYAVSAGNIPAIATQVYEGLVSYDWDLNPVPNLAKCLSGTITSVFNDLDSLCESYLIDSA